MSRTAASQSLPNRMIGAARLDVDTYEDVERDVNATGQAAIVVVLVAVATGIGALRDAGITGFIFGLIQAIIGWIVWSGVTYWVGKTIFKTENTRVTPGEMLRALGFARSPGILNVLGIIHPAVFALVMFVTWVWSLIAGVIAIRQAMDFTTGRAIGTGVVALIPVLIIEALILAIPRAILD